MVAASRLPFVPPSSLRPALALLVALLSGCGDDDTSAAAPNGDAGVVGDAGPDGEAPDAGSGGGTVVVPDGVDPDPFTMPANVWVKLADVPDDPFGRELQPGRGAFWAFDPTLARFFRYGGYTPTETNDLWSFDPIARRWAVEVPVDHGWPPPANRPGAGPFWHFTYDSSRRVFWLLGGVGVGSRDHAELYDDLWRYDPATGEFTAMQSTGYYHGSARIAYDSVNDLVVRAPAYDGEWSYIDNRDKTWIYDPKTNSWEGRSTPGSPKHALSAGFVFAEDYGVAVYLAVDSDTGLTVSWTYDAATNSWAALSPPLEPPARVVAGVAYDRANRVVIVHGGVGGVPGSYGYLYRGGGVHLDDTWVLDLATSRWTELDVGAPPIETLIAPDGSELLAQREEGGRFEIRQAMDYDSAHALTVVSAPTFGVWALRYEPAGSTPPPAAEIGALSALPAPGEPPERVYPQAPVNQRLLDLPANTWTKLEGGGWMAGGEIPWVYDPTTGFMLLYGGCNDAGTTFASGYGNDLTAYDPATERWIAIRATDPCGPPRPKNGCTRFYAADASRAGIWFAGGTAGNNLAASLPRDWPGGAGTWFYHSLADRFEYLPSTESDTGAGVVCFFDPVADRFVTVPGAYSDHASAFDASTHTWSPLTNEVVEGYTFGAYVDSLGAMMVNLGGVARTLDATTGTWTTVEATVTLPGGRPGVGYDPTLDIVLVSGEGGTVAYDVGAGTWSTVATAGNFPGVAESLAFDTRHGVFLARRREEGVYALRYVP